MASCNNMGEELIKKKELAIDSRCKHRVRFRVRVNRNPHLRIVWGEKPPLRACKLVCAICTIQNSHNSITIDYEKPGL